MKYRTQQEIRDFLENLVWNRFTEKELNEMLSDFFGEPIGVYNASQGRIDNGEESDELADWNLMFNIIREDEYELFADIYMLPTREVDEDNNVRLYITEVGYDFC